MPELALHVLVEASRVARRVAEVTHDRLAVSQSTLADVVDLVGDTGSLVEDVERRAVGSVEASEALAVLLLGGLPVAAPLGLVILVVILQQLAAGDLPPVFGDAYVVPLGQL